MAETNEGENCNQPIHDQESSKRTRIRWDEEKHRRFIGAVESLGIGVGPSKILAAMKVEGLTAKNVASHLQQHRSREKKAMKEKKKELMAAARAISSRNQLTIREAGTSASPLDANLTSEKAKSPAMEKLPLKFSNRYDFMLHHLNKSTSEHNNRKKVISIGKRSKKKKSKRKANREALLKNPSIPVLDLTEDSDCEKEHTSEENTTTDLTEVVTKEENNDKGEVSQESNNAAVFVEPINPNKMSCVSLEKKTPTVEAVEANKNTNIDPLAGNPLQEFGDELEIINEFFDDPMKEILNQDPVVNGLTESVLPSNENGTVEEKSLSSDENIWLDIGFTGSPYLEMSFEELNDLLDFGGPCFPQESNNAQSFSAEKVDDGIFGSAK